MHTPGALPKNIFQTYETKPVSSEGAHALQSWQQLNPNWTYHFFTAEERKQFIENHFDQETLWAYEQLIPGAFQADLWRYCILYIKGGIYADHKFILHKPLDEVIPLNCTFATFKDLDRKRSNKWDYQHYLLQGLLIASPGHPFLKRAI